MTGKSCPAFVTIGSDRQVRCDKAAGHGPAEDVHHGLLRVVLPDGREQAASVVWSTTVKPWDEGNLRRSS